jgi:alanine racemase
MEHQRQARPTVAEIDGHALADNFAELARVAGGGSAVIPVIKADAYGHGLTLVGRVLHDAGAERFAVATVAEGEALRASRISDGLIVLGGVYPAEHERVVAARLTPVVWDIETPRALAAHARAAGRVVPVHVKIDTGMRRLGVPPAEAPALVRAIADLDGLTVEGLLTHFADAESVDGAATMRQLAEFERLVAALEKARLRPPLVHAANSAATLTLPRARFDAVRPGLALYGIAPSAQAAATARLRPAMRFVTGIIATRPVAPGVAVGYAGTFVARRPSVIATLPVGYADGYPRALSNRGEVVIRGVRAPVAGRVCMDQTMIDVTDVPGAAAGDEVILWGGPLPVEEVAVWAETIPYELLTRVGARVPRTLVASEEDTWHGSRERS